MINFKRLAIAGLAAVVVSVPVLGKATNASASTRTASSTTCTAVLDVISDLQAGHKGEAIKDLASLLPKGQIKVAINDLLAGDPIGTVLLIVESLPLPSGVLTDIVPDILSLNITEAVEDLLGLLNPGAVEVALFDLLSGNVAGAEAVLEAFCP